MAFNVFLGWTGMEDLPDVAEKESKILIGYFFSCVNAAFSASVKA